jgi:hypothetical protein
MSATDYFIKWIEAVPTRQATDVVIIQFLEKNILSMFGFPIKIITDNVASFKPKKMEKFCSDYNIVGLLRGGSESVIEKFNPSVTLM